MISEHLLNVAVGLISNGSASCLLRWKLGVPAVNPFVHSKTGAASTRSHHAHSEGGLRFTRRIALGAAKTPSSSVGSTSFPLALFVSSTLAKS
jgi:hypothetical protein